MFHKKIFFTLLWECWIWLLSLFALVSVDLASKYFFYDLEMWKHSYRLEPVMNIGISFSWSVPYRLVIPLSLVALGWFFYLYHYKLFSKIVILLLIAWTLGNLYDRILFGGVRDFLVLPDMFIFNIADVFLSVGMCIAIYHVLFVQKNKTSS
jgi:signal peptidase II